MSRFTSSYGLIGLLAVLSTSPVASINSVHSGTFQYVLDAQGKAEKDGEEAVVMLQIDGMMCAQCAETVERTLSRVPGVRGASVSHITQKGQVQFHPSIASKAAMIGAVKGIGFHASLWQERESPEALLQLDGVSDVEVARFRIDGMMCAMCSARVESALSGLPGVRGASVSPTTHVGQVQFHPSVVPTDALVQAIEGVGFVASLLQEGDKPEALLQFNEGTEGMAPKEPQTTTNKPEALLQPNGEEAVVMLQIDGMMCDKCAAHVERALSRVPGVHEARVSHTTHKGQGQVQFHPGIASTGAMVDAVQDLGFGASLLQVQ